MEERVWHKAYIPDLPPSIDYETITLPQALSRTAKDHPDNVALILMGKKITYRQLDEYVNRFANALAGLGIRQGDKVALVLPNTPQIVIATYAIWRLGGVVVMNNPLYTERELEHQLNDSDSRMAVVMDLVVPRILSIKDRTQVEKVIACHVRDFLPFPLKQLFPVLKRNLHRRTDPAEGVLDFSDLLRGASPEPPRHGPAFDEWIPLFDDPILAQSALDQLAPNAYQVVMEGDSFRKRQRPGESNATVPLRKPRSRRRRVA